MDMTSLRYWISTIDNLMTHDRTTFKDLLGIYNDLSHNLRV